MKISHTICNYGSGMSGVWMVLLAATQWTQLGALVIGHMAWRDYFTCLLRSSVERVCACDLLKFRGTLIVGNSQKRKKKFLCYMYMCICILCLR